MNLATSKFGAHRLLQLGSEVGVSFVEQKKPDSTLDPRDETRLLFASRPGGLPVVIFMATRPFRSSRWRVSFPEKLAGSFTHDQVKKLAYREAAAFVEEAQ